MSIRHGALWASRAIAPHVGKRPWREMALHLVQQDYISSQPRLCHLVGRQSVECDSRQYASIVPVHRMRSLHHRQLRWNHSSNESNSSSGIKPAPKGEGSDTHATTSSSPATHQPSKKRRRASSGISSLSHTHTNHPKYSDPPSNYRTLTRKQILRLTPKQRKTVYSQRLQGYKDSQTYLDQARTNVRKNIKFLGDRADTNLKKNIATIKRLFKGEEVWNDAEKPSAKNEEGLVDMAKGIEWERAPAEIKANFMTNVSKVQNWLHKTTDGMIPSSNYVGIHGKGEAARAGSIATRVQQFHELKQDNTLVMDNRWFAKNVFIALLPGLALNLYFQSKQKEMKEYYEKLERLEREKILGPLDEADGDVAPVSPSGGNASQGGGMSVSTALITEGGSTWDKLKMTVNDLFLGGAQERISKHKEVQNQRVEANTLDQPDTSAEPSTRRDADIPGSDSIAARESGTENRESAKATAKPTVQENNEDPTILMLVERIHALEAQLDKDGGRNLTKEDLQEQHQKEHELKYSMQRKQQSPMQNRRDDHLRKKWQMQEASEGEAQTDDAKGVSADAAPKQSYSIEDVFDFAKLTLEPKLESTKRAVVQKIKDLASGFGRSDESNLASSKHEPTTMEHPASTGEGSSLSANSSTHEEDAHEPEIDAMAAKVADSKRIDGDDPVKGTDSEGSDTKPSGVKSWVVNLWRRIRKPRGGSGGGRDAEDERQ